MAHHDQDRIAHSDQEVQDHREAHTDPEVADQDHRVASDLVEAVQDRQVASDQAEAAQDHQVALALVAVVDHQVAHQVVHQVPVHRQVETVEHEDKR